MVSSHTQVPSIHWGSDNKRKLRWTSLIFCTVSLCARLITNECIPGSRFFSVGTSTYIHYIFVINIIRERRLEPRYNEYSMLFDMDRKPQICGLLPHNRISHAFVFRIMHQTHYTWFVLMGRVLITVMSHMCIWYTVQTGMLYTNKCSTLFERLNSSLVSGMKFVLPKILLKVFL